MVTAEHTQLEMLLRVCKIADSRSTLSTLNNSSLGRPPTRLDAVNSVPHAFQSEVATLDADTLNGNSTLILGTAHSQVLRVDVENAAEVTKAVLRLPASLVQRKMNVRGKTGTASCESVRPKICSGGVETDASCLGGPGVPTTI